MLFRPPDTPTSREAPRTRPWAVPGRSDFQGAQQMVNRGLWVWGGARSAAETVTGASRSRRVSQRVGRGGPPGGSLVVAGGEDEAPRGTPGTVRVQRKDSPPYLGRGWLVDPGLWHQRSAFCFLMSPMLAWVPVQRAAEPSGLETPRTQTP